MQNVLPQNSVEQKIGVTEIYPEGKIAGKCNKGFVFRFTATAGQKHKEGNYKCKGAVGTHEIHRTFKGAAVHCLLGGIICDAYSGNAQQQCGNGPQEGNIILAWMK